MAVHGLHSNAGWTTRQGPSSNAGLAVTDTDLCLGTVDGGCPTVQQWRMPNMYPLVKDLVSVSDAAERTGISKRTLYWRVRHGKVWSVVVGDKIMLHEDDVSAWEGSKAS